MEGGDFGWGGDVVELEFSGGSCRGRGGCACFGLGDHGFDFGLVPVYDVNRFVVEVFC